MSPPRRIKLSSRFVAHICTQIQAAVKTNLVNTSFASLPNLLSVKYVLDASNLLQQIRNEYPDADITLTGHSLGGGIAQMVGSASDYPTAIFDAPGAQQVVGLMGLFLSAASASNSELGAQALPSNSALPAIDTAYRYEGDQISLVGTQIGKVETVINPNYVGGAAGWLNFLTYHSMDALDAALKSDAQIVAGVPDDAFPGFLTGATTFLAGDLFTRNFITINVVELVSEAFDPGSGDDYEMTETAGSPLFYSITLPDLSGVSSYEVSIETGSTWSADETLQPGVTLTPSSPFDGFQFTPLNSSDQPVNSGSDFVFDVAFATSGTFSGTLTEQVTDASVAQFLANQGSLDETTGGFVIEDLVADVTADLAAINADPNVMAIGLTGGGGTPTFTLSVAQALDDLEALGVIVGPYDIAISDLAANVAANIDTLDVDTNVVSIRLTDFGTPTLALDVAQALGDTTALGEIVGPYAIAIADTVGNVGAKLAAIDTLIEGGRVSSLTRTDVTGQAYSSYEQVYDDGVYSGTEYVFTNVTGEPYSSYDYDYSAGNDYIGSKFYYTGITGKAYTGEEVDYNGAGLLTKAAFTGVTGAAYSSYQYDYVGGVFSGSQFTFTKVPTGATYSSYQTDYDQAGHFTGDQFFFTNVQGQSYTGEEEDFDASSALSSVLLTGIADQAYSSLKLDYSAGTYEGYQAYYTGVTGQSYTNKEVDVSAAQSNREGRLLGHDVDALFVGRAGLFRRGARRRHLQFHQCHGPNLLRLSGRGNSRRRRTAGDARPQ